VSAELFADFRGYVIADASSVYHALDRSELDIIEVCCWAHARRQLFDALTLKRERAMVGIGAWRTSQDFTARTGTNIERIDNTNYAWFLPSMQKLDPYSLPHDHHELIAMIAPRAFIALGNQDYEWLGGESGWKSINAAKERGRRPYWL